MRKIKIIGTKKLDIIKKFTLKIAWNYDIPRGTLKISIYDNNNGMLLAENFVPFEVQIPAFSNIRINVTYSGSYSFYFISVKWMNLDGSRGQEIRLYSTESISSFIVDDNYFLDYAYW
jgi:hypothetical protein